MEDEEIVSEIVREALQYYERLREHIIFEDNMVKVSVVDNVLIIQHDGILHIYIVFTKSRDDAEKISKIFIELYKHMTDENISIDFFVMSIAKHIDSYYDPLYSYYIYERYGL